MRDESNRLIEGMRNRHQAEDKQAERDRRAMEADQAYQERITKENNAIELKNLQIESEREIGGINDKIKQSQIDAKATTDILSSIADFSTTAGKYIADQQAQQIKSYQGQQVDIEDLMNAQRAEALGTIAVDAANIEEQVKSNEDTRESIKPIVTNPGRLGRVGRAHRDRDFLVSLPGHLNKANTRTFTAANGKTFTGLEIENNPQLASEFYGIITQEVLEASGLSASDMPETMKFLEGRRRGSVESALNASFQQDKAILVGQTNTLLRTGKADDIAVAYSGGKSLGNAKLLEMMSAVISDPNISEEKREAVLNFVLPIEGNTKPFRESHYDSQVGPALAELRDNQTKFFNDELKARKAEANNWVLQSSDIVQTEIDNTSSLAELEEKEVQLKEFWQDKFPGIEFPSTLTGRFSTAKKGNQVDIRDTIDRKFRNKELDLSFINSITDATLKKHAKELLETQQVELYGEGYKPLMANIESLSKKAADFSSIVPGDTNGTVEAIKAKMLQFVSGNHKFSLSNTGDANVTSNALTEYVANAAITGDSNGDPQNPFRYREGTKGREYVEIGVPDPDKQQYLNWVRKKAASSGTLGDLIKNNPYLIPADKISEVPKAQEAGKPIVFDDVVYFLSRHYNQKPTEIHNAIVTRVNQVSGSDYPMVTPNDFTELQDNSSPEWNKLISSGNYDQVRRAGAQVTGQLPMRSSMGSASLGWRKLSNVIRFGEGTLGSSGYNTQFTGTTFTDTSKHPRQSRSGGGYTSDAAGAYQFLSSTWDGAKNALGLTDFSPESQEKAGRYLTQKRGVNPDQVFETKAEFKEAMDKLAPEWASLPYSGISPSGYGGGSSYYGQGGKTLDELWEIYQGS